MPTAIKVLDLGLFTESGGPLLVFGGPYSNLRSTQALRAVADALNIPPERSICTGDVVAYCAEPAETVATIRAWGCHVIAGNCEEQLALGADDCGCGFEEGTECDLLAKGWYPFAKARVPQSDCAWMGQLPQQLTFDVGGLKAHVLHGGRDNVSRFVFASQADVLTEEAGALGADLVIAGHAGLPFMTRVNVPEGRNCAWFNPGVIGMPANDGQAVTWYGLLTPRAGGGLRLSTHRLLYDARSAAAQVRRWGYADGYARSLVTGVWPSHDILPPTELAATGRPLRSRSMTVMPMERAERTSHQAATLG